MLKYSMYAQNEEMYGWYFFNQILSICYVPDPDPIYSEVEINENHENSCIMIISNKVYL